MIAAIRDIILIAKDINELVGDIVRCQLHSVMAAYRQTMSKVMRSLFLMAAGFVLAMGGLVMIVCSFHILLGMYVGPVVSGLIIGTLLSLSSVILLLAAKNNLRDSE
jgi:hypothetical protein